MSALTVLAALLVVPAVLQASQQTTTAQEKVKLKCVYKAGQVLRYTISAGISPQDDPQAFSFALKMNMEDKVVKVNADGTAEAESRTLSGTITFNDQEMEMPTETEPQRYVIGVDGFTVSRTGPEWDREFERRLTRAVEPVFPKQDVAIGETWKHEHKPDPEQGWRGGTVTEKLLAVEEVEGIRCAKVEHRFEEKPFKEDEGVYNSAITYWLELSTGQVVKADGVLQGFVNQQMGSSSPMKMTMKMARTK